jgi:hypothetical protein
MDETAKVLERVRKLLALAGSPDVHEAQNAAGQAARLMARHRITAAMLAEGCTEVGARLTNVVPERGDDVPEWRAVLLATVCTANHCVPVRLRGELGTRYGVVGRDDDARAVGYLHAYLARAVETAAEGHAHRDAEFQRSFRLGMVAAFVERLQRAERMARDTARREGVKAGGLGAVDRAIARVDSRIADAERAAEAMQAPGGGGRTVDVDSSGRGHRAGYQAGQHVPLDGRAGLAEAALGELGKG